MPALEPPAEARYEDLGGRRQMVADSHRDLSWIHRIDAARWAAPSVPLEDLQVDPALGRMLVPAPGERLRRGHVLDARDWLRERLDDLSGVDRRSDVLELAALAASGPGAELRGDAAQVLETLGVEDRDRLSLAQLRTFLASFERTLANGDGVVVPKEIPDAEVSAFARRVLDTVGGRPDGSGARGVGHPEVDAFLEGVDAYRRWRAAPEGDPSILPLGDATAAAWDAVEAVRGKVEEWFLLCGLAEQEGPETARAPLTAEEARELREGGAAAVREHLEDAPVARPRPDATLSLGAVSNPLHRDAFDELRTLALEPLLGEEVDALDRGTWRRLREALRAHEAWRRAEPSAPFRALPAEDLDPGTCQARAERLRAFVDEDAAASRRRRSLRDLEKLLLLQRWILPLVRNMVSFSDLYDPETPALFQRGTLVLDGRRLDLTVLVRDRARHKKLAAESGIFLVYASVLGEDGAPVLEVAAPVTAGERGRIRAGKRGLLVDPDGREWDAEVVDVVENPISLREAVRSPFVRFGTFLRDKVQALATSSLELAEAGLKGKAAAAPGEGAAAPAAAPMSFQSLAITLSLATAALGSAAAFMIRAIAVTDPLRFLGSLLGILALIAAASGVLGWLRLRRRDMSPLLEANGWAVNVPMALTRPLGHLFTQEPVLPGDPRSRRGLRAAALVLALLLTLWAWSFVRQRLRERIGARPAAAETRLPSSERPTAR